MDVYWLILAAVVLRLTMLWSLVVVGGLGESLRGKWRQATRAKPLVVTHIKSHDASDITPSEFLRESNVPGIEMKSR